MNNERMNDEKFVNSTVCISTLMTLYGVDGHM